MKIRQVSRWIGIVLALTETVSFGGCGHQPKSPASLIDIADPSTAGQLTVGFYGLEGGRWRWTAAQFSVMLQPPPGADEKGGYLELHFFIPDEQLQKIGPMTLTANLEGQQLGPQTIAKGGFIVYRKQVPVPALQSSLVNVSFSFDKAFTPGNGDARTLGAVVSKVLLQSK